MKKNWQLTIGLEVHAELSTKTKIFCGCSTAFGAPPNTHVCPACTGIPGSLPVLNRKVVEFAVMTGLALNCHINRDCIMDRKNYFYPDLPKAYQVSQLYRPICVEGAVTLNIGKRVGIKQIHMEEDASKLIHEGGRSYVDYNRGGVPLLEIVTHPDMSSADEAVEYLTKLRETLLFLGVCDCKMQEGSIRCDVNLSVAPTGSKELGVRTETKNLNSFRAVTRTIEFESMRQIELIESGGKVVQETRRWDDGLGETFSMRSKENAQDYRYFPDPDLLPILIDDKTMDAISKSMPELAESKRRRYIQDWGLSEYDAAALTQHKTVSDLFEGIVGGCNSPKEAANLVTGEVMRLFKASAKPIEELSIDAGKLATLVRLVLDNKISRNAYKEVVGAVFESDADPDKYIIDNNLMMVIDTGAADKAAREVVAANPSAAADYKAGITKAFGSLMGQTMKKLGGTASPDVVRKALESALRE